jgi:hypothetical protein
MMAMAAVETTPQAEQPELQQVARLPTGGGLPPVTVVEQQTVGGTPDWRDHKLYSLLQSAEAKRAFVKHAQRTIDEGIYDKNNKKLPTLPTRTDPDGHVQVDVPENDPEFYRHSCLEEKYGKPALFVSLSRSFTPTESITNKMIQKTRAVRNLPHSATEMDISDMVMLQSEVYKIVANEATSKANLLLIELTQKAAIPLEDGSKACRPDQVRDLWHKNPSRNVAKAIYEIGWGPREDGITFPRIMLDIIVGLRIWFPAEKESEHTRRGPVQVPKAHFVSSLWHNKFRERVRRDLLGDPPHGVTITISTSKKEEEEDATSSSSSSNSRSNSKNPRRKKRFIWESNVKGWDSTKHRNWKRQVTGTTVDQQPSVVSAFFMFNLDVCAASIAYLRYDVQIRSQACHEDCSLFYYYYIDSN